MESYQISFTIYDRNVSDFVYVCFFRILFAALVLISLEILLNLDAINATSDLQDLNVGEGEDTTAGIAL